jgi:hypothetical protein
MTEAEEVAAKAVSLAREVIDKYGADADKPSVKLAIALINGAHERDRLRTELKETQLVVTRMLPWQKLSDAQEGMVERLTKERDEARAQRDELEHLKHVEERPIRTELRLLKAERNDLKAQLDELIEATILGPLKGKTAHDEIVSLRAEVARVTVERDGWESVAKDSAFKLTNLMLDADQRTADRIAEYVASTNPGFAQVMLDLATKIRAGAWRKP